MDGASCRTHNDIVFTVRESVDRVFPRDVVGRRAGQQFGVGTQVVRSLDTTEALGSQGT